jgi:hypothetical protein
VLIALAVLAPSLFFAIEVQAGGSETGEFPDRVFTVTKGLIAGSDKASYVATILPSVDCSWWVELSSLGGSAVKVEVIQVSDPKDISLSTVRLDSVGDESERVALAGDQEYLAKFTYVGRSGTSILLERSTIVPPGSEGWQEPTLLQTLSEYEQAGSVGMDDQGNAVIIWEQPFEGNYSPDCVGIWWIRYDHVSGWGEPAKIWDGDFICGYTALGVGPGGQAVAAWYAEVAPEDSRLHLSLYDPASGWGSPTVLQVGSGYGILAADVDGSGNAMVIVASQPMLYLTAAIHEVGSDWRTEEITSYGGAWPHVRYDGLGCAMVLWDDSQVMSSRYVPGVGWGPVMVASGSIGGYWAELDVDDTGRALATFFLYNGTAWQMYGNLFDPVTGWGTPVQIGPADNGWHPFGGFVSAGAPDQFFVIWEQATTYDGEYKSVWSRTWSASSGWGESVKLNEGYSTNSRMFTSISACENGEALASWTEGDNAMQSVVAARYTPGTGWAASVTIDSSEEYPAYLSYSSMAPNGDTVIIWRQSDGENDLLWGRVYLA